jgi:hypothetical protein
MRRRLDRWLLCAVASIRKFHSVVESAVSSFPGVLVGEFQSVQQYRNFGLAGKSKIKRLKVNPELWAEAHGIA